jgi:hypothetical protein
MNPIILIAGAGLLILLTSKKSTPKNTASKNSDSKSLDDSGDDQIQFPNPNPKTDPIANPTNPPVKPFAPPNTTKPKIDPSISKSKGFTLKNCEFKYSDLSVAKKWAFNTGYKYYRDEFTEKLWDGCNLLGLDAVFTQSEYNNIYELLRYAISGSVKSGKTDVHHAHMTLDFFIMKAKSNYIDVSKWKTDFVSKV